MRDIINSHRRAEIKSFIRSEAHIRRVDNCTFDVTFGMVWIYGGRDLAENVVKALVSMLRLMKNM